MPDRTDPRRVFGERAARYTASATHTDPVVLGRVVALAAPQPDDRALDVGTGTGHTAFALAPHLREVVALDLTPEMLAEGERLARERGIGNVTFQVGDAHDLPFADRTFQVVTCRRAAHHFRDIGRALAGMARVLAPGGRLVIDDRSVPADDFLDRTMNALDLLHDESHVREYRPREWREMVAAAGLAVTAIAPYTQHRPLSSLTKDVAPARVREILGILEALTPAQREAFDLREVEGVLHIRHWYLLAAAAL